MFLSYASQDAEAARRICDVLRASGVEVWFDQSELVGGDAWDAKIRKQIKECALFIPLISANTQARLEGYFRLEWKLAEDRSHLMARGKPFIVPVTIDATTDHDAHVPDSFLAVQWMRLPGGTTTSGFAERVSALLCGTSLATERVRPAQGDDLRPLPRKANSGRWWAAVSLCGVVAFGALVVFAPWRSGAERKDTAGPTADLPESRKIARQARALIDDDLLAIRENYRLAEELCRKAAALDVGDAEAWATWARVSAGMIERNYEASASRRAALRSQAERAIRLAPDSVEAGLAIAAQLATSGSADEAETRLRALLAKAPRDPRVPLALARVLRQTGKPAEATELRLNHPAFGGRDPRPLVDEAQSIAWSFPVQAAALVDRAQAMAPSLEGYNVKLILVVQVGGDLEAGQALVKTIPARIQQEDVIAAYIARLWLWVGDGDKALAALRRCPNEFLEEGRAFGFTPKGNLAGWAQKISGREAAANAEWTQALAVVEKRIVAEPERPDFFRWKAQLLALLARAGEADKAWQLYTEMAGPNRAPFAYEAEFDVAMGRKEEAINRLQAVAATEWGPRFYAYGLRYNPWYAALRDDPRVQALIAEGQAKLAAEPGAATAGALAPQSSEPKSVAVLAFANLSDDKANEYFSDGISEELLNVLAKVPGLKVSARTSAFYFKGKQMPMAEIAKQLGVAYVVEGSVRKQGDKVRITAQLIKAADGFQVWADQFDRELKDIFAVQDEIAAVIARNLSLKMGVTAPVAATVNPAVFQLYTEARQLWNVRSEASLARMEQLLSRALQLDRHFAPAEAGLAQVWVTRAFVSTAAARDMATELANAVAHATKAIALDPTSAEAFEALGTAALVRGELAAAETAITRAVTLNPNYATGWNRWGWLLARHGRVDEAVEKFARGKEIDPLAWPMVDNYGLALMQAGRHAEAIAALAPIRTMPDSAPVSWANGAVALMLGGRNNEALTVARVVTRGGVKGAWSQGLHDWSDGLAAWVLAEAGARDEARVVAERLLAGPPAHRFAAGFSLVALGREDEGCAALAGMPQQLVSYLWLLYQRHEQLADDSRFQRLLRQLDATTDFHVARETLARLRAEEATKK